MAPALFIFMVIYLMSFLIVLGSEEWFLVWVGMEMNMFSFVSMVYESNSWKNVESLMKYFFIQGLSSGVFLVLMYVGWGFEFPLMMKMAAGPFFFWLPGVMMGLGWGGCFFMMTFQSVIPLVLLSGVSEIKVVVWGVIGVIVGVVGSYGQSLASILMAFSSVNHVGWMMLCQVFNGGLWVFYFLLYVYLVGVVLSWFYSDNVSEIGGNVMGNSLVLFFLVMSMAGLPPFVGFVMKWIVLEKMIEVSMVISLIMIVSSLVMVYVYSRLIYGAMMSSGDWMLMDSEEVKGYEGFYIFSIFGMIVLPLVLWCCV